MNLKTQFMAACALGALGAGTYVQDAAAQDERAGARDVVTVTAQRREQALQDVPLAISALGGELLEDTQTNSFEQLQYLVPSLSFQTGASDRDGTVSIRGVGTSGRVNELDPAVGIFVDGIFMDRTGNGVGDFIDIERVEVLRGPQGTLFGKNTPAGLVHFITREPEFEPSFDLRATIGNYESRRLQGTATSAIAGEVIAGRVSFFINERDGFFENRVTGNALRNRDRWGVRSRLLFAPSDSFEAIISADYGEEDEFGPGGDCLSGPLCASIPGEPNAFDRTLSMNTDGTTTAERWGTSAELNLEIGEYTLTSITGFRSYEYSRNQDGDYSPVDLISTLSSNPDQEHWTQEIRLQSPSTGHFDYVLGAYYFDKELVNDLRTFVGSALFGPRAPQGEIRTSSFENTAWSLFAHGNYRFAEDRFNLFAGLRYTDEEKVQTDVAVLTPLAFLAGFGAFDTRATFEDQVVTWTAGLQYFPSDDLMAYASVATGYKSGGTNSAALRFDPTADVRFAPEESTSYEAGLKATFWDGLATANIAVFYTNFDNFQATQFDAVATRQILTNAGSVVSHGIEFDGTLAPFDGLTLTGAFSLNTAEYDTFQNAVPNAVQQLAGLTVQDLSGQPLANAPEFTGSLTARYERPLTARLTGFIQGEAYYRGDTFLNTDLDPNVTQDGYTLLNARIGVETDHIYASLYVENASDEDYLIFGGDVPFSGNTSYYGVLGDPQTYGVQLGVRY
jgi:iron complex outermembrane receptor protein